MWSRFRARMVVAYHRARVAEEFAAARESANLELDTLA